MQSFSFRLYSRGCGASLCFLLVKGLLHLVTLSILVVSEVILKIKAVPSNLCQELVRGQPKGALASTPGSLSGEQERCCSWEDRLRATPLPCILAVWPPEGDAGSSFLLNYSLFQGMFTFFHCTPTTCRETLRLIHMALVPPLLNGI